MRGGIAKRAEPDRNGLGLDSCGKIATRARLLREDSHAGPTPAGGRPRHPQRNREIPRDKIRLASEGGTPLTVQGKKVWTDADPAPVHEHFIYLIYTPTMTNESTHVPSEVQTPRRNPCPIHPHLPEGTQLPLEKERTGSPLLTRALADIRKGFLAPTKRNQPETSSQPLPPNPHTRSKIIPL